MAMNVLQERSAIESARKELDKRGLSSIETGFKRILRKLRLNPSLNVGDEVKSWDVLETVLFIERNVSRDGMILDIGAVSSEILIALHRLGFRNLTGVDLDPNVKRMPHAGSIKYEVSDFMNTPFQDASFDAITSISVIEHGFNEQRLLSEVSRLLRPGGVFVASFDYWPFKIDTADKTFFGMDWKIFSSDEIKSFIANAAQYGLTPVGELKFDAAEKAINHGGKNYTFGWLALRKKD